MPFFSFGMLSTHWCQAHQQIVMINPGAVADNAGADYSLKCSEIHMWGRFVSGGCSCRSWWEVRSTLLLVKAKQLLSFLRTTPAGQNSSCIVGESWALSFLVLSFISLLLAPPISMRLDHFFLFFIFTEIFFLMPPSFSFKHPGIELQVLSLIPFSEDFSYASVALACHSKGLLFTYE